MTRNGSSTRPRLRLRRSIQPLLCALAALCLAATPASASSRSTEDLEAQLQAAVAGVSAESAPEVVDRILAPNAGVTGYHQISPASFFQSGLPVMKLTLDTASGSLWFDTTVSYCMFAPVRLPQGAAITGFVFWARDNNTDLDADATLYRERIDHFTPVQEVALATSSGATSGARIFTDFTIQNGTVDNTLYWYYAYVCMPGKNAPAGPAEMRGLYVSYTN